MLKKRKIAVLALTAVIAVALLLVLTCSAVDIPLMQPKLENATVDPGTTSTWDQTFTYAVNGIFSDMVSIILEVYNLSLHEWTAIGDRTYNGTGEWQSLTWEDVNICSGKCEGTSSYRFKYNGSILLTESGPTIAPPTPLPPTVQMFKDAMVKPAYGHYNDSFTYSVFAQLNQTTNITLEVFDISSYVWKEAGENQSYTETGNWQLLSWANVTNVSAVDGAGVASYRFLFFDAGERRESVVFYGPELDLYPTPTPTPSYGGGDGGGVGISPKEIVEDVKEQLLEDKDLQSKLAEKLSRFLPAYEGIKHPEIISAGVTLERGSWNESFDYWVEVVHPNRTDMWLTLEVYCPSKEVNCTNKTRKINSSMYDESNIATVEWRDVKVFCEADVKAEESPKYYIQYNDSCNYGSREFTGPKLNSAPNLSHPMVIPEKGTYRDLFVFKVNVSDEDGDDVWVTLHVVDPQGGWIYNETHLVSGLEPKYLFCWGNVSGSDSVRIKRFFTDDLNIKWAESATISKYNNDMINICSGEETAAININESGERATLTIHDEIIQILDVKKENGKLKIYSKGNVTESWIYYFTEENVSRNFNYTFTATDGIDYAKERKGVGPSFEPYKAGITTEILITAMPTIGCIALILLGIIGLLILVKKLFRREIEEEIKYGGVEEEMQHGE